MLGGRCALGRGEKDRTGGDALFLPPEGEIHIYQSLPLRFFIEHSILNLTWMLILKLRQVVHILVDDDPQAIRLAVRSDVVFGKSL